MKCEDCKYWESSGFEPEDGKVEEGFCHRYAPRIVEGMLQVEQEDTPQDEYGIAQYPNVWDAKDAVWPKITAILWCGEFEQKKELDDAVTNAQ